jgi:hypothetical protein
LAFKFHRSRVTSLISRCGTHGALSFLECRADSEAASQNTLLLRRYFVLDATASHTLGRVLDVFVPVENLLNQRYDVGRTPVLTIGPPILARASLRLEFGSR